MSSVIIRYEYATVSRLDLIVVKQMQDPNSDHYTHTIRSIPAIIHFLSLFIDSAIPDVSTYEKD